MGQDPDSIRQQIAQTRDRMGETVDALGYKADVPARTRESITGRVDSLKAKVTGAGATVADAAPDGDEVRQGARQAVGVARENPLGLAIGAAAAGFLAGLLVPGTKIEDERLGPVADQVKEQAQQAAHEALDHGRQIAGEAAQVVSDTAGDTVEQMRDQAQQAVTEVKEQTQESVQGHAEQMSDSVSQSAEEVANSARAPRGSQ